MKNSKMAAQQSHTFASHTNRHTSQSLQKSVPAPAPKEFKNIFPSFLKKGKTLQTQSYDRQKSVAIQTPKPLTGKCFNYSVDRRPACNSTYKKLAVQWLNEALCFVSSSVLVDSFRLRNRQLLVAANR